MVGVYNQLSCTQVHEDAWWAVRKLSKRAWWLNPFKLAQACSKLAKDPVHAQYKFSQNYTEKEVLLVMLRDLPRLIIQTRRLTKCGKLWEDVLACGSVNLWNDYPGNITKWLPGVEGPVWTRDGHTSAECWSAVLGLGSGTALESPCTAVKP